jgi:hypothetical protein
MMYFRTRAYNRDLTPASDSTGFKSFFFLPAEFAGGGLELEEEAAPTGAAAAAAAAANFVAAVAAAFWAFLPRAFGGMRRDERLTTRGIICVVWSEGNRGSKPDLYLLTQRRRHRTEKKMAKNGGEHIGPDWGKMVVELQALHPYARLAPAIAL